MVCHFLSFIGLKCSQFSFRFVVWHLCLHPIIALFCWFVFFWYVFVYSCSASSFSSFFSTICCILVDLKKFFCDNTHSQCGSNHVFSLHLDFAVKSLHNIPCETFNWNWIDWTRFCGFIRWVCVVYVYVCGGWIHWTTRCVFSFSCHALQKAFASALRTVDDGLMLLLLLLLLLSFSLPSWSWLSMLLLLLLCAFGFGVQAHCPLFCRRQRSVYTFPYIYT